MRLEEEIKQQSFQSEIHKLVVNILFTANWLKSKQNKVFRRHGISLQQFNVLRILKGQHSKPASLALIRERMLDKESNASRLVDKLCAAGYTERIQCPEDRRQVEISITSHGVALLEQLNIAVSELNETIDTLPGPEARKLNELLDKLRG